MAEGVIGMTVTIDPLPQTLTANEKRVKELLDRGETVFQIAYKLHMSFEAVRDIIFEIRKKECLMAGKPRLTQEERAEIYRLYREEGMTYQDIAPRFGVSKSTVGNIIAKMNDAQASAEHKMPNTGVNPDFERAVDDMIADAEPVSVAADEIPASAKPDRLPQEIAKALMYRLRDIDEEIEQRKLRIAELKREIEALDRERGVVEKWREEHE